jgi:membrane protease subunit HflC
MNNRIVVIALAVVGVFVVLSSAMFTVHQTERAVLLRFREIVSVDLEPGLHFKVPFVDVVRRFDGRVQTLTTTPETYFTVEKKPLMVDSFVKWRINDVDLYFQVTSGDSTNAERLLRERVITGLRNQISRRGMRDVVSGERDQLARNLTREMNVAIQKEFGIQVIDVRVKRIELPVEVSESVYRRMISEREIEAKQHRARGEEKSLGIRAAADRAAVVIAANAYRDAEQIRGEGDGKAAAIYSAAYSNDPEFYAFYRSLGAYRRTFSSKSDVMVIDPSSRFFRYMRESGG